MRLGDSPAAGGQHGKAVPQDQGGLLPARILASRFRGGPGFQEDHRAVLGAVDQKLKRLAQVQIHLESVGAAHRQIGLVLARSGQGPGIPAGTSSAFRVDLVLAGGQVHEHRGQTCLAAKAVRLFMVGGGGLLHRPGAVVSGRDERQQASSRKRSADGRGLAGYVFHACCC